MEEKKEIKKENKIFWCFSFALPIFKKANQFIFLLLVSYFLRICGKIMWVES